MPSDLERIESYHRRVEGDDDCGNCGQAFPCDVVKLARELDGVVDLLGRLTFAFDPDDNRHADLRAEQEKLKRVLREVAGGDDD